MSQNELIFQKFKSTLLSPLIIFYCLNIQALFPKRPLGFDC